MFSPDGARVLTASRTNRPAVGRRLGQELRVLRGHEEASARPCSRPTGRASHRVQDKTARLWDAASGQELRVLRGHEDVGPLRRVLARRRARPHRVQRQDRPAVGRRHRSELRVLRGHEGVSRPCSRPTAAASLTASADKTARLWDAASGSSLLRGHEDSVSSAVFARRRPRLTASYDTTARLWDAASGKELRVLRGHEETVCSAVFSPDGACVLTASEDRTARLWDAASGQELRVLRGHEGRIRSAVFSPDGRRVLTASATTPPGSGSMLGGFKRSSQQVGCRQTEAMHRGLRPGFSS